MKIAVLSDIHANMQAFKAVLDDIDAQAPDHVPDKVISLGDNVGYGGDPEAVMDLVAERGIPSVAGNHELGVADARHRLWFNPTSRRAVNVTADMLRPDQIERCAAMERSMVVDGMRFVHAFPPANAYMYLYAVRGDHLQKIFDRFKERICFVGHTHMLELVGFDGKRADRCELPQGRVILNPGIRYVVNVGAVGQPRDDFGPQAKYVVFDTETNGLDVRFVDYDVGAASERIRATDMPDLYADRLLNKG